MPQRQQRSHAPKEDAGPDVTAPPSADVSDGPIVMTLVGPAARAVREIAKLYGCDEHPALAAALGAQLGLLRLAKQHRARLFAVVNGEVKGIASGELPTRPVH